MKTSIKLITSVSLAALLGFVGVQQFTSDTNGISKSQSIAESDTDKKTINISYSADFPYTENLQDMYQEADLVAIGRYDSFDSSWNMARNPADIKEEDSENYVEGHLYNFKIEEILAGESDKKIKINLRYEELVEVEDEQGNKLKVKNKDPLFLEPETGEKYLVFLKKDLNFGNYYGAIEPFQILLDKDDIAQLKTNLKQESYVKKQVIKVDNGKTFVNIETDLEPLTDKISGKSLVDLKNEIASYGTKE
ncbi:cardiolipin synthase [Bacillus sp. V3-13]|uniref:cardiolipin synthase n=1 Tax=Bacillus sp. V3-13 TaxID=2053728 RepID=UPI000C7593EA|nr:cardiolipin synthase [Bacillus sp. V3-13]PLR75234.1 cardiolipin synthase [Bacillus sp. V3-13]